ncbi:NUDIX hydrolase [Parafrigoribacterium soli]|uniref:NUDIX hydrolase n=1 Tax=Parafrigoribacterium soli TaxID=3144663 RepID=UPI0032EDC0FB
MPETAPDGAELLDEPFEAPIVSSDEKFHGHVWDVRRDRFEYGPSDATETITREYVDHTGAVAILALDDEDRAMLIRQYRHPIATRDWEIPAGLLDVEGEKPLHAAQRELAEEADLEASEWAVLADFFTSPGGSTEAIRVYVARGLQSTPAFERTEEEADLETRWVSLEDIVDAVLDRRIGNSILSIAALAAHTSRARGWSSLGDADAPWPQQPHRGARG